MSNLQEKRVLVRVGARLLSEQELQQIAGGFVTNVCTNDLTTGKLDGDCLVPPA